MCQDHGLYSKERAEEQPRPPLKANDYSSSSESSESSEESESGEGAEEESPTDRYETMMCEYFTVVFWFHFSHFSFNVFISPRDADSDSVNTMVVHEEEEGEGGDEERAGGYGDQTMLVQRVRCLCVCLFVCVYCCFFFLHYDD